VMKNAYLTLRGNRIALSPIIPWRAAGSGAAFGEAKLLYNSIHSIHYSCKTAECQYDRSGMSVRILHPLPLLYSSIKKPDGKTKKSPPSQEDGGLIDNINPHQVLTPKTVREHPCRSSGSPLAACLPNRLGSVACSGSKYGPMLLGRDYSGGSAPDFNGIPFAWMWSVCGCFITWRNDKVKIISTMVFHIQFGLVSR
jgi:hypothetical protein